MNDPAAAGPAEPGHIGHGDVAHGDVPPGEAWVGNPARRLRTLDLPSDMGE